MDFTASATPNKARSGRKPNRPHKGSEAAPKSDFFAKANPFGSEPAFGKSDRFGKANPFGEVPSFGKSNLFGDENPFKTESAKAESVTTDQNDEHDVFMANALKDMHDTLATVRKELASERNEKDYLRTEVDYLRSEIQYMRDQVEFYRKAAVVLDIKIEPEICVIDVTIEPDVQVIEKVVQVMEEVNLVVNVQDVVKEEPPISLSELMEEGIKQKYAQRFKESRDELERQVCVNDYIQEREILKFDDTDFSTSLIMLARVNDELHDYIKNTMITRVENEAKEIREWNVYVRNSSETVTLSNVKSIIRKLLFAIHSDKQHSLNIDQASIDDCRIRCEAVMKNCDIIHALS